MMHLNSSGFLVAACIAAYPPYDAPEIQTIVDQDPNLSNKFVPVLFDDVKDKISIYLSTEANTGLSDVLEYYLGEEEIKTDTQILNEFSNYYKPTLSKK